MKMYFLIEKNSAQPTALSLFKVILQQTMITSKNTQTDLHFNAFFISTVHVSAFQICLLARHSNGHWSVISLSFTWFSFTTATAMTWWAIMSQRTIRWWWVVLVLIVGAVVMAAGMTAMRSLRPFTASRSHWLSSIHHGHDCSPSELLGIQCPSSACKK